MEGRSWVINWLRHNKAQFLFDAEHHQLDNKMVSVYLVPSAGIVLRYRVERGGVLDMDELFIPAGGKTNQIANAKMDLDEYASDDITRLIEVRASKAWRRLSWVADRLDETSYPHHREYRKGETGGNNVAKMLYRAADIAQEVEDVAHGLLKK